MLMQSARALGELENASEFVARHIGIDYSGAQTPGAGLPGLHVYRVDAMRRLIGTVAQTDLRRAGI